MAAVSKAQLCVLRVAFALAIVAGVASGVDAATASWDPNTEPDVAGYRLSYGTAPGVHTVTIDVGNVITYQFFPPPGRTYYVVVQAYNTAGELSEKSAEVVVDIPLPNSPPTLTQPVNQSTTLNSNASLALAASDPDGTVVEFQRERVATGSRHQQCIGGDCGNRFGKRHVSGVGRSSPTECFRPAGRSRGPSSNRLTRR